MNRLRRSNTATALALGLVCLLSLGLFVGKLTQSRTLSEQELAEVGAYVFEAPRIIKAFDLVDQAGRPFTLERLQGQWSLLFFGYTYCPDVCPTTLAKLTQFSDELQGTRWAGDTRVILATVDPARDSPAVLARYLDYFDPDFVGITGDFMALQGLAANVNAAFTKVVLPQGGYTIDHTSNIVLVNPYGHYHGFFKPQAAVQPGQFDPIALSVGYQAIRRQFGG